MNACDGCEATAERYGDLAQALQLAYDRQDWRLVRVVLSDLTELTREASARGILRRDS